MQTNDPATIDKGRPSLARRAIMGAGYLPGYGDHPGTGFCLMLTLLTGAAAAQTGGWIGFAVGTGIGALVYGSLWLCGCVGRANAYLRRNPHDQ